MVRHSIVFGGLGSKAGTSGDTNEASNTDSGEILQQRRRSSIRVPGFMSSLRRLCDGVQRQARSRSNSNGSNGSDVAKKSGRSTENLVAASGEGCSDAKSVQSVSRSPDLQRDQACSCMPA